MSILVRRHERPRAVGPDSAAGATEPGRRCLPPPQRDLQQQQGRPAWPVPSQLTTVQQQEAADAAPAGGWQQQQQSHHVCDAPASCLLLLSSAINVVVTHHSCHGAARLVM